MSGYQSQESNYTPIDTQIEAAMRSAPLTPPPPLLYAAVMRRVRLSAPRSRFWVTCLDVALSLFIALLPGLIWLGWRLLPPLWLEVLRLQAIYSLQRLWYLEFTGIFWAGISIALMAFTFIAAAGGWFLLGHWDEA